MPLNDIILWDRRISKKLYDFAESAFWRKVTVMWFRNIINFLGIPVICWIMWQNASFSDVIIYNACALLLVILSETVVKSYFRRKRPILSAIEGLSFPSSHAAMTGYYTTVLLALNPALAGIILPFAFLVPLSRVLLGYHYVIDVAVGLLGGIAMGLLVIWWR